MVSDRKKIYLMVASQPFGLQPKDWLDQTKELSIIADIEPVLLFKKAGADVTPGLWLRLTKEIYSRLDSADGFVVLHGVDNLLYTASALSFLLQNLNKPVIFTGSQSNPADIRKLEIRANLINSVQSANYAITEVCLMFGNRLLRANQASRSLEESLNVFTAPASSILGRIDFSIRIFEKAALQNSGKVKFFDKLSDKIEIIQLSPFLSPKVLAKQVGDKEGIIVNANIYQTLPEDLIFLLEKITPDIPVVIWSKKISATVLVPKNILVVNNLTWETTVTKFMWAVAQTKNVSKIKELILKDIAGEIMY